MFEFKPINNQIIKDRNHTMALLSQQEKTFDMSKIMFVGMAESGTIAEENVIKFPEVFEEWQSGVHYTVGQIRKYTNENEEELLYMCDIEHDSQENWTPNAVNMWHQIGNPKEEYPAWIQPLGAEGAYALGDKVSHNGKKWESTADSNVWEPGFYGWVEIVE